MFHGGSTENIRFLIHAKADIDERFEVSVKELGPGFGQTGHLKGSKIKGSLKGHFLLFLNIWTLYGSIV